MANRPVYIPKINPDSLGVITKYIDFEWFPGMSVNQKQKSILSLHRAAAQNDISPLLEISTKSNTELGVMLSAFHLMIKTKKRNRAFSVENAFQSSKVFQNGGPYIDLLNGTSSQAKKDIRLKESGNLIKFVFFNEDFPLEPRTFFYDWIYINALHQNKVLSNEVMKFNGFTDIEFNPKKSINCQAYSAALYVSLRRAGVINEVLASRTAFLESLTNEYNEIKESHQIQRLLL
ncbi:MAG: hypothetical protein H6999_10755 [Hahellaceae bacterium]|nr:hypothetical protein [Hahellaceae bacterium]